MVATPSAPGLRWDAHAANLSNRTLKALAKAGIRTWGELVREATRTPNVLGHVEGIGHKGISEIKAAMTAAKVETTFRSGRHR